MEDNKMLIGWIKEPNRYRLVPDKEYEIKYDERGFFYLEKKKKEYPKTYEECCRVLGVSEFEYNHTGTKMWYRHKLMATLDNLMLCRDAYWKLYGEEMGLGKPWKPDWTVNNAKYSIYTIKGVLTKATSCYDGAIFVFPTEEMRDAFYESFKYEIEICKELL